MTSLRWSAWAARLLNQPLLIEPKIGELILRLLAPRFGIGELAVEEPGGGLRVETLSGTGHGDVVQPEIRNQREYRVDQGVATIPVVGELANRGYRLQPMSGLTSYHAISRQLDLAMADQEVRGVLLDVDSPGGELGCMELGERIRSLSDQKPIWALADNLAASAAYAIGVGASRLVATPHAQVGSVGVIAVHTDLTAALEQKGVRATIVRAGARKAEGNSLESLSDATRADWQAQLDAVREDFVKLVANLRSIAQRDVRGTEAAVLSASDAKELGFVDAVQPRSDAIAEFHAHVNRGGARRRPTREKAMAMHADTEDTMPARASAEPDARAIVLAERARIGAILRHEAAEGCMPTALGFALDTDLPAEQAIGLLATVPKAAVAAAAGLTPFERAMAGVSNPRVGADPGELSESDEINAMMARARQREGRS